MWDAFVETILFLHEDLSFNCASLYKCTVLII